MGKKMKKHTKAKRKQRRKLPRSRRRKLAENPRSSLLKMTSMPFWYPFNSFKSLSRNENKNFSSS